MKKRIGSILVLFMMVQSLIGQVDNNSLATPAQLGFSGLIYTPSAYLTEWKTVDVGFTHFSKPTSFSYRAGEAAERAFIANVAFFPFAEMSLKLTRPYSNLRPNPTREIRYWGIGDRSIALRLRLLKETDKLPAIVLGIQDPFFTAESYFDTNYLVLSKTKKIGLLSVNANLGFGYSRESAFLDGLFGGVKVNWNNISGMIEYDTQRLNLGLGYQLRKRFFVQTALIEGKYFSGNVSFRFSLN